MKVLLLFVFSILLLIVHCDACQGLVEGENVGSSVFFVPIVV
ncbi:hypothetical protein [Cognataquiflexum nitidum]|nr:hypothetical protein [Cognataquiflexum nitidum]